MVKVECIQAFTLIFQPSFPDGKTNGEYFTTTSEYDKYTDNITIQAPLSQENVDQVYEKYLGLLNGSEEDKS